MSYDQFKNQVSSEKITLATLEAAKRLIAFTLHSGSIYKIENFDYAVISSIEDSGVALTEVFSVAACTAGKFYNDRDNKVLYLRTSDSANPNGKFLHAIIKFFFSSSPVTLPWDLSSGFDVYWEPQIESTSDFGVEIDTVNQQNEAIEGSGSLNLYNDQSFWPANFEKLFFENQNCEIYSWNRDLEPSEAKLLFKGKVESKDYSNSKIAFKLKDLIAQLRNPIPLSDISELGLRNQSNLAKAKQRLIYGRVFGHKPINVDEVIDGRYPLTGTVSTTNTSTTVSGSGTQFLKEVSPDDRLLLNGTEYTVASVTDDDTLELTEAYAGVNLSGVSIDIMPDQPKRWINRVWKVAGHPLREPSTTVQTGSSTGQLFLGSTEDMFDGDFIYVGTLGSGELVQIGSVKNSTTISLATSLSGNPVPGTAVFKPSLQNVMIDDVSLVYYRDYTLDSETATLTLRDDAEVNAAPIREAIDQGTFTNGSRSVTGSGTFFKSFLKPGYVIRPKGSSAWHEILSVDSDESITLRTAPSGLSPSPKTANVQYKQLVYTPGTNTLHCEVIGKTLDGSKSTRLLRKAPEIVKQLLLNAGFAESDINETSFTNSLNYVPEDLSFVVPTKFDDRNTVTYREVINRINKSVFGIIFQDNNFQISYDVLRPFVPTSPVVIRESDCLKWSAKSTNKNMLKRALVEYGYKEYDFNVKATNVSTVESVSDLAQYILDTSREKTFPSLLINEEDAQRLCNRWKFLLEFSTTTVKIETKLQLIDAEINDIIDFEHRKFYERFSGTSKRKFLAIEKINKTGNGTSIQCVDLSNAFNRIALITDTTSNWSNADEDIRIRAGFISDQYGLINNDESSFQVNLIW